MADQIKELLEKIQKEGVEAAEEKARTIETEAALKADAIIRKAEAQVKKALEEAQATIQRGEASSRAALQQASRDTLLSLKTEINAMLDRLIKADVSQALGPEELSRILSSLIKDFCAQETKGITVTVSEQDRQKLEANFLGKLKQEARKGIELTSSESIQAGFIISFDAGKSQFDFTDAGLSEYIGRVLKPKLAELLNGKPTA